MREEAAEQVVIGQRVDRGDLQAAQRDVRPVEVDCGDRGGVCGEIAQRVAAAAGDAENAAVFVDLEPFHVDHRVFPNLGVDQPAKGSRKGLVEQCVLQARAFADHRTVDDVGFGLRHGG